MPSSSTISASAAAADGQAINVSGPGTRVPWPPRRRRRPWRAPGPPTLATRPMACSRGADTSAATAYGVDVSGDVDGGDGGGDGGVSRRCRSARGRHRLRRRHSRTAAARRRRRRPPRCTTGYGCAALADLYLSGLPHHSVHGDRLPDDRWVSAATSTMATAVLRPGDGFQARFGAPMPPPVR
jgi:hypothetical protein